MSRWLWELQLYTVVVVEYMYFFMSTSTGYSQERCTCTSVRLQLYSITYTYMYSVHYIYLMQSTSVYKLGKLWAVSGSAQKYMEDAQYVHVYDPTPPPPQPPKIKDRAETEPWSSGHRARIERRGCVHRADTSRHRAGEIVRPSSMLLENSISASCFLPIKKERPPRVQKWYLVEGPSSTLLENSISASCFLPIKKERPQECRSGYVVEGVLKAKPQTRHRAWLMCYKRTRIEHASSEQKKEIERRPSRDRAEIEHPWYQLRAAR